VSVDQGTAVIGFLRNQFIFAAIARAYKEYAVKACEIEFFPGSLVGLE